MQTDQRKRVQRAEGREAEPGTRPAASSASSALRQLRRAAVGRLFLWLSIGLLMLDALVYGLWRARPTAPPPLPSISTSATLPEALREQALAHANLTDINPDLLAERSY